jgi:hypothetical protein
LKIKKRIFSFLEEQKIDLILKRNTDESFVKIILKEGVPLT